MKHKRISRRELKKINKELRQEQEMYARKVLDLQDKYYELQKRFEILGKEAHEIIEFPNGRIQKYAVEAKAYGSYMCLSDFDPETRDYAMNEIARQTALCLIKYNLIKFDVKEPNADDPLQGPFGIVGGTLYVVPWEQVNRAGRHMVMQKFQNLPEDGGGLHDPDHN